MAVGADSVRASRPLATVLYSRRSVAPRADAVVSAFGDDHSRAQTASTRHHALTVALARCNDCAGPTHPSILSLGTIVIVADMLWYHSINLVLALARSLGLESSDLNSAIDGARNADKTAGRRNRVRGDGDP